MFQFLDRFSNKLLNVLSQITRIDLPRMLSASHDTFNLSLKISPVVNVPFESRGFLEGAFYSIGCDVHEFEQGLDRRFLSTTLHFCNETRPSRSLMIFKTL